MDTALFVHCQRRHLLICFLLSLLIIFVGCSDTASPNNHAKCSAATSLTGSGSTFDATLFDKQFSVYATTSCGLPIAYYAVGSGAGASQLLNHLVDFGATDVQNIPADLRFYIVNAPKADAYPLAGYSWVIVYRHQNDTEKGKAVAQLLWWMINDGQQYAKPLMYVPLATNIVINAETQIRMMTCGISSGPCFLSE